MAKVYLSYVEDHNYRGSAGSKVYFLAGPRPIDEFPISTLEVSLNHVVETKDVPYRLLEKLEMRVFRKLRIKPAGGFQSDFLCFDEDKENPNKSSQTVYTAFGRFPGKGETEEHALQDSREYHRKRNQKILGIYKSFVKSISAREIKSRRARI